jgi:hypothetical protein
MKSILVALFSTAFGFAAQCQQLFPEKCLGSWQGTLHIFQYGQLRDSVPVLFTVNPLGTDAWTWKMEYRSEKMPMTKDYVLRLKDREKHIFVTDEGNGVELTDYQTGDKLYSVFETAGILLTASYELRGESLVFEVTSGKKEESKNKELASFATSTVQRVVLRREQ